VSAFIALVGHEAVFAPGPQRQRAAVETAGHSGNVMHCPPLRRYIHGTDKHVYNTDQGAAEPAADLRTKDREET
jgi:hypothetical protein